MGGPSSNELVLYGALFVIGGIALAMLMLGLAIWYTVRARAVERWLSTTGQVIASTIRSSGRSGYRPQITYQYEVGGQTYQSQTLSRDVNRAFVAAEAQARADQYPVGRQVRVLYDPARPDQAVLEMVKPTVWWLYLIAAFSLLMGVCGGVVLITRAMLLQ